MLAGLLPASKEPQWVAYEYPPLEESEEILKNLLTKYWAGLVMPLHFFPSSSWDYVYSLFERDKPQGEALESARNAWSGTEYRRGECEDVYYHLCFGNTDPFDAEFERTATAIFKPLLEHQKELIE
jgi:exodeoxyribonuclease V gamma subunit